MSKNDKVETKLETITENDEAKGILSDSDKEEIDVMEVRFSDEDIKKPIVRNHSQPKLVTTYTYQQSPSNPSGPNKQPGDAWGFMKFTGFAGGILMTSTSHYYKFRLIRSASIYSGSVTVVGMIVLAGIRMKHQRSMLGGFGAGCYEGLNASLFHLIYFWLPVGLYSVYKVYFN
jgi:hypothetical protein